MIKNKNLSKLLLKKTTGLFKVSLLFFFFSMLLIILGGCLLIKEYENINQEFIKNENTHMIKITYKWDENNQIEMLKFQDEENIKKILDKKYRNRYDTYGVYQIECGINSITEDMYYIKAINPKTLYMLGKYQEEENVIYQNTVRNNNVTLQIPKIRVSEGGCEAYDYLEEEYKIKQIENNNNIYSLYTNGSSEDSYITYNDYKKIIEQIYNIEWNKIQHNYDNGDNYGMNMIESYYIYVNNISEVKVIAEELEDKNYCTQYTIKAFENLDGTVRLIIISAILFVIVIVMISTTSTIISFRNYYKLQQKDMGILKQMGYSQKTIWNIYSHGLNGIFGVILSAVVIVGFIMGMGILGKANFIALGIVAFGVIILMIIIWAVISNILYRYTQKDILVLLKLSKETE